MGAALEAKNWLRAARRDLEMAVALKEIRRYEGAAFHSQQCAEKAAKALALAHNERHHTHSASALLEIAAQAGVQVPEQLIHMAKRLDKEYSPSRYPNAVGGAPEDFYDQAMGEECVQFAKSILDFVSSQMT